MKIKFGSIVTDGRGKIGGHVASKNRGGAYLRTKVTPVNPQSALQTAVRALLTVLSQGWRALTATQRAAWNAAVENFKTTNIFGDIKSPSGINLYVRLNANINTGGGATISSPPSLTSSPTDITLAPAAAAGAATFSVVFGASPVPANTAYVIEATPQISQGKSFVKNLFRVVQVFPAADATPTSIHAAYIAMFGALVAGTKIVVRGYSVDLLTGVRSQPTVSEITVAA